MPLVRGTVATPLGTIFPLVPKGAQAVYSRVRHENDVASVAAVPSVGTPAGHELLAMEPDEPVPTVAAPDVYFSSIDQEFGPGLIPIVIRVVEGWRWWIPDSESPVVPTRKAPEHRSSVDM
jgi:hypothetical protein